MKTPWGTSVWRPRPGDGRVPKPSRIERVAVPAYSDTRHATRIRLAAYAEHATRWSPPCAPNEGLKRTPPDPPSKAASASPYRGDVAASTPETDVGRRPTVAEVLAGTPPPPPKSQLNPIASAILYLVILGALSLLGWCLLKATGLNETRYDVDVWTFPRVLTGQAEAP